MDPEKQICELNDSIKLKILETEFNNVCAAYHAMKDGFEAKTIIEQNIAKENDRLQTEINQSKFTEFKLRSELYQVKKEKTTLITQLSKEKCDLVNYVSQLHIRLQTGNLQSKSATDVQV